MKYSSHGYKLYDRDEIKNTIIDFYNKNGKIVLRDLKHKNNLPSQTQVINEFGSFQNCLIECNIPLFNKRIFNRKHYTDDELINMYKDFVVKHLQTHIFLPTNDEVDASNDLPCTSVYIRRFNSFNNLNKIIGYDQNDFNNKALEKDMLDKYINACKDCGHTLNSREITILSKKDKKYIYSTEAYRNHFGTIHNLQKLCNLNKTVVGRNISKEEMIILLQKLGKELKRKPVQTDLINYDYMPSLSLYIIKFGSFKNALLLAGYDNVKIYYDKLGIKYRSSYELRLANIFYRNDIIFDNEILYKDIIKDKNFKKNYRFDFCIMIDTKLFFIEIFGINNNEKYDKKTEEKIQICKKYKIPLISLYSFDFLNKSDDELFEYIFTQLNRLKE